MRKHGDQVVQSAKIVAFVGHRSVGKTSLCGHILCSVGVVRTLGRVDNGDAFLDTTALERRRHLSVWNSTAWMERENDRVTIIDTPGSRDFRYDRDSAVSSADAVVLVVDETRSVSPGAQEIADVLAHQRIPAVVVLNKIDTRRSADVSLAALAISLQRPLIYPQQLYFDEGRVVGIIDVIKGVARRYASDNSGEYSEEPLTDAQASSALAARDTLVEAVSLTDDGLLECFLEDFDLSDDQLTQGIRTAINQSTLTPVMLASSTRAMGGEILADVLHNWVGSSYAALSAPVRLQHITSQWHAKYGELHWVRVLSGVLSPKDRLFGDLAVRAGQHYQIRGDRRARSTYLGPGALVVVYATLTTRQTRTIRAASGRTVPPYSTRIGLLASDDKKQVLLTAALDRFCHLDPSLTVSRDQVLTLHGTLHLDRWVSVLEDSHGVDVHCYEPPIAYRERLVSGVDETRGVHEKLVDGEVSEYGQVTLSVAPANEGHEVVLSVAEALTEDDIPEKFRDALLHGVAAGAQVGPIAGLPVIGLNVRVLAGEYDMFQSTDDHFWAAGSLAMEQAIRTGGTEVVEPWSVVEVYIPSENVGVLLADAASHDARIVAVEVGETLAMVTVEYPERELRPLRDRFASMAAGRGGLTVCHQNYRRVPEPLLRKIMRAREREQIHR